MTTPLKLMAERIGRHPWKAAGLGSGLVLGALAALNGAAARRAERRHPPEGRFESIDGVGVHYREAGEGRPVVLLHGNGAMAEDFVLSGLFDRLARRYHVVAPDRPGFGHTERPRDRTWTPRAQAELVRGLMARLGLRNPIVIGHSWGTLVAVALALETDALLRGLVLLSGYYYPTRRPDVVLFSGPAMPVLGDVARHTVAPVLGRVLAPVVFKQVFAPLPVPRRFETGFPRDLALRPAQIRASAEDTAMMVPAAGAFEGRYRDLRLPVAILAGAGDRVVSPDDHAVRLRGDIRGSALHVLPGIGHMIHYAAPDRIAEVVSRMAPP
jgi:pimeloyl-ACP methyl ester carboxylesterase